MNLLKCKINCVTKFTKTNNITIKGKRDVKRNFYFVLNQRRT